MADSSGAGRIRAAFAAAAGEQRTAFIPYLVCGRPQPDAMPRLVGQLVDAGADVVELGLPFSDPLADGAVIRDATRAALDSGVTIAGCLDMVRDVRAAGIDVPLVLMGYVNPLLRYGLARFCHDAAAAGADGLIVPDVPLDEGAPLRETAAECGLASVMLVTPLTSDERLSELAAASSGFLYAVATTGTTGAREEVDATTIQLLDRARAASGGVPVAVGFGISTAAHVSALAPFADGVIVGSAIVAAIEADAASAVEFVGQLAAATYHPEAVSLG